jgi:hypothetical protein
LLNRTCLEFLTKESRLLFLWVRGQQIILNGQRVNTLDSACYRVSVILTHFSLFFFYWRSWGWMCPLPQRSLSYIPILTPSKQTNKQTKNSIITQFYCWAKAVMDYCKSISTVVFQ